MYKGLKPVLWCTQDQTALAEAEVEYENHTSPSVYVKFPLVSPPHRAEQEIWRRSVPCRSEDCSVVIWTTTPWTLPANQAVCLHPTSTMPSCRWAMKSSSSRTNWSIAWQRPAVCTAITIVAVKKGREGFEGLETQRPLTTGLSPILLGDFVTLEQGTGCVHIAPGHGMEDYLLVLDHNAKASVRGTTRNPGAGGQRREIHGRPFRSLPGNMCSRRIPKSWSASRRTGRLLGHGSLNHSYPHCWRCKQPVIFRATEQWFVSMETNELRQEDAGARSIGCSGCRHGGGTGSRA